MHQKSLEGDQYPLASTDKPPSLTLSLILVTTSIGSSCRSDYPASLSPRNLSTSFRRAATCIRKAADDLGTPCLSWMYPDLSDSLRAASDSACSANGSRLRCRLPPRPNRCAVPTKTFPDGGCSTISWYKSCRSRLRRRKMKVSKTSRTAIKRAPPTVPPTITPVCEALRRASAEVALGDSFDDVLEPY